MMDFIGGVVCYLALALFAATLWLGDKGHNKLSLLCLFFWSVDVIAVVFIVAITKPPTWLGDSLFFTKLALNFLFLCGVVGLLVCFFFFIRWFVRLVWQRRAKLAD
jgi:hypothetical protein